MKKFVIQHKIFTSLVHTHFPQGGFFFFFFFFFLQESVYQRSAIMFQRSKSCPVKVRYLALQKNRIGSKFLPLRFFSRRFKPLRFECQNRVTKLVPMLFKSTETSNNAFQTLFQRFYLCRDSLYENVNITYTSAQVLPCQCFQKRWYSSWMNKI